MRPTVVIVDDHASFRQAAVELLESEGFAVVGTACDGIAGLEAVETLRPQVVVLDIHLPDLDGFDVADRLARRATPPAVVLISSRDRSSFGERLVAASARGFIEKRELSGARLRAILG
jgi:DNA-binding NarL/FixJ family response regulator